MFHRIRWQLIGWNIGVLALILAVVGAVVYLILAHRLIADVDQELARRAQLAADRLRERPGDRRSLAREGYVGGWFYLLVDHDGEVLVNPQRVRLETLPMHGFPAAGSLYQTIEDEDGGPTRLYLVALPPGAEPSLALVVGKSLVPEYGTLRQVLLVLLLAGVAGMALSCAGAWFLAGRALVPIEAAMRRQQEFVADASHELRTPLTVLRSAIDLLDRHRAEPLQANGDLFDDVRDEIARLERQTVDLLTLARSDLGELQLALGLVDVAALAADVVRRSTPLAQHRAIVLTCQRGDAPLLVEADPDRLQQVLLILLDNALKHTPAGGMVTVGARRHGGDALLEVADSGPGIPPEHLPRVFDRYYRADRARSRAAGGTGLGLAIAQSLVVAHGGHLTLANVPGGGLRATIRLRLARQHASLAQRVGQLAVGLVHRPPPR